MCLKIIYDCKGKERKVMILSRQKLLRINSLPPSFSEAVCSD